MKIGESITLNCPSELAIAGTEFYSSNFKVPADTDITYKIDILDCANSSEIEAFNIFNKKLGIKATKINKIEKKRVIGTSLKEISASSTHDSQGNIKRGGGGVSEELVEKSIVVQEVSKK